MELKFHIASFLGRFYTKNWRSEPLYFHVFCIRFFFNLITQIYVSNIFVLPEDVLNGIDFISTPSSFLTLARYTLLCFFTGDRRHAAVGVRWTAYRWSPSASTRPTGTVQLRVRTFSISSVTIIILALIPIYLGSRSSHHLPSLLATKD